MVHSSALHPGRFTRHPPSPSRLSCPRACTKRRRLPSSIICSLQQIESWNHSLDSTSTMLGSPQNLAELRGLAELCRRPSILTGSLNGGHLPWSQRSTHLLQGQSNVPHIWRSINQLPTLAQKIPRPSMLKLPDGPPREVIVSWETMGS